jgi:hypothetical protein
VLIIGIRMIVDDHYPNYRCDSFDKAGVSLTNEWSWN